MDTRTVGALAFRPTDNGQGGYFFYSLATGMRLNRTHWTELPMPNTVKDRVHALTRRANADKGLVFHDSDGNDLDIRYPSDAADDDDSDYDPEDDEQSYDSDDDVNTATDAIVAPIPGNAGVDDDDVHDDDASSGDGGNDQADEHQRTPGVNDQADEHQRTPGVNNDPPGVHPGVNNDTPGVATNEANLEDFLI
jgi:hypothetical protein